MTVYPVFHFYTNTIEFWKSLVCICPTEESAMAVVVQLESTPHDPESDRWDWEEMAVVDKLL